MLKLTREFSKTNGIKLYRRGSCFDEGKIVLNDIEQLRLLVIILGGKTLKALVVFVDDESNQVLVNIAGLYGVIEEKGYSWAEERLIDSKPQFRMEPNKPRVILNEGDLIYVKLSKRIKRIL